MKPDPTLTDMDPEQGRAAACEGKERFASGALASKIASRRKYGGAHPYRCAHCGAWHIGRRPGAGLKHKRKGRK